MYNSMSKSYWLLKTEPSTYSFQQLLKDKRTHWNGVRNFQARNYLKTFAKGDIAFIYHSGDERAVVGIAKVVANPYPDPDPKKPGEWVQVDLEPTQALKQPISLAEIKAHPDLIDVPLIKQSRLSVLPITAHHYETILKLSRSREKKFEP